MGDSKVNVTTTNTAVADLETAGRRPWLSWTSGVAGETVAVAAANISTILAGFPDGSLCTQGIQVITELGINDVDPLPDQATWIANFETILDAVHAKWPSAKMYLMRLWKRNELANCNTLDGWIETVVAARSAFTFDGPDERVWLENGDNGVTYTSDGGHYNTAGSIQAGHVWASLLFP